MSKGILLLILASVSLSALAQITLKFGMSSERIQRAFGENVSPMASIWAVASNFHVLIGLLAYGFGAIIWLLVLAKLDVSAAYPFVGLGFILTMLLGHLLLGESLSSIRIVGTFLVVAGVILVSRS